MPNINVHVPEEFNNMRKAIPNTPTWKDVILAGLGVLSSPDTSKAPINPAIESNLKLAVKHLSEAWNMIKQIPKP